VISEVLIGRMKLAGVENFHLVLRKGKWDIPGYFGGGNEHKINVSYHITDNESAVPFTINTPYPYIKDKNVVFGFPDIFFLPEDAILQLKEAFLYDPSIDMVFGLFEVSDPINWDTVAVDENNWIRSINIKQSLKQKQSFAWITAIWKPVFSSFLNNWLLKRSENGTQTVGNELQLSNIIMDFIGSGHKVKGKIIKQGDCIDTGTIEGLQIALNKFVK
jgi:glucose-1-phosphate thymidylyltransferase